MSIQKNSDEGTDVGFRPVSDIRPDVPEKLRCPYFIIQITGRMLDGHPSFSGRMSDTGLNPHLSFFGCLCMHRNREKTFF